jgi:PAS domain S-box-containing protein
MQIDRSVPAKFCVLVVERDPSVRALLTDVVQSAGFAVDSSESLERAGLALADTPYAALVVCSSSPLAMEAETPGRGNAGAGPTLIVPVPPPPEAATPGSQDKGTVTLAEHEWFAGHVRGHVHHAYRRWAEARLAWLEEALRHANPKTPPVDSAEQTETEQALREMHSQTEALLHAISVILIVLDEHDRVTRWNEEAEETFGVSAASALHRAIETTGIDWDWMHVRKTMARCRKTGQPQHLRNVPFRRGDERKGVLSISVSVVPYERCGRPGHRPGRRVAT